METFAGAIRPVGAGQRTSHTEGVKALAIAALKLSRIDIRPAGAGQRTSHTEGESYGKESGVKKKKLLGE